MLNDITKEQVLADAMAYWNPGKTKFWQEAGVPLVIGRREGYYLWDMSGHRLIDCHLNGGTYNVGHRNPEVIAALIEGTKEFDIGNHHFPSIMRSVLCKRLAEIMPGSLSCCVLGSSGGEAIDVALKCARYATKRRKSVSIVKAYHGHTGLALGTADAKYAAPFLMQRPEEFIHVPFNDLSAMEAALKGGEPDPDDAASFETLGRVTAHLHEHVIGWAPAVELPRHHWDLEAMFFGERPLWGRWQDGLGMSGERVALLDKLAGVLRERIEAYGKGSGRYGLIHSDLRLANLLIDHGKFQVIDFDDCGFGWFLYDLASALSFIEESPHVPDLVAAWLRGYRSVRDLEPEDEAMIPTFIMARRLLLTAWVGSHQEAPYPRQLGEGYTAGTCALARRYLSDGGVSFMPCYA